MLCSHRQPHLYEVTSLPAKLPPPKQPMAVTSLPLLGYLEQSVANSVINGLSAVGAQKPKYPFLSSTNSALIYLAYHLKGEIPSLLSCISHGWFAIIHIILAYSLQP